MPASRRVGLLAELCVKKSSPIVYNGLDLFIGKSQAGRILNKSLTDAHWLWLHKPLTTGEPPRQDEVRFPRQIQHLSEQSTCGQRETLASSTCSPEEEGKHRPAHRSLLWRLTSLTSHVSLSVKQMKVLPQLREESEVWGTSTRPEQRLSTRPCLGQFLLSQRGGATGI